MKACLMKVNYDPKYINPNQLKSPYAASLDTRLSLTKEIYGPALPERKHLRETLEDAAKKRIKHQNSVDAKELARIQADAEKAHIERYKKSVSFLLPMYVPPLMQIALA